MLKNTRDYKRKLDNDVKSTKSKKETIPPSIDFICDSSDTKSI